MSNTMPTSRLVAILFVASSPMTNEELSKAAELSPQETTRIINELPVVLRQIGLSLTHLDDHYKLVTSPEVADTVRKYMLQESNTELSKAALETLAIIAYRGPISRSRVEDIRGVSSDVMIRNLLSRGLITEAGRSQDPGKPVTYAISHSFLEYFGLESPDHLPPAPEPAHED